MTESLFAIRTLDDLRAFVHKTLCDRENILQDQFGLTETVLIRGGRDCGLHFWVQGPRSVRLEAIWVTACSTMACGKGMISRNTPIRIRPPAMPNTPDSRAVRIIRQERLAASRAVMATSPVECRQHVPAMCTLQIYDK